jgi:hypothetical protein
MKTSRRSIITLAAGSVLLFLFSIAAVWGLCPLNGYTLTQLLSERENVTFKIAALMASLLVAAAGTCSVAAFSIRRDPVLDDHKRSGKGESRVS